MLAFDVIQSRPLSGRGAEIQIVKITEDGALSYYIKWGGNFLKLSKKEVDLIMGDFFSSNEYKPLGASQTSPLTGGFGEYLNVTFKRFTPRHASAIASLMVIEDFITFNKDGKSIFLKRSTGKKLSSI